MSAFAEWYETYERDGGELMLYNTIDLEAAFKAGMLRAAEIADAHTCSDCIESGAVCEEHIAAAIRKEVGQ